MPLSLIKVQLLLPQFLLVLFRVGGLTIATPMLSSRAIPARVRVALAFVVALMIFPVVRTLIPTTLSLNAVVVSVFGELLIGLIMGTAVGMLFVGARLAGLMIGQQAGIALGQVVNPMLEGQTTIIGQMYFLVAMMIFLAIGGHRAVVTALLDSFQTLPPGSFRYNASMLTLIEQLLADAFILAIRLGGPALTALFLASLTMGVVSRTIPQINVLTIGFAVRVFVALTVAALSLSLAYDLLYDAVLHSVDLVRLAFGMSVTH